MPYITMIVKVRIYMNTHSRVCRRMYIGSKNNGITWLGFRYEKLHIFRFYYGVMGHNEDFCKRTIAHVHGITEVNPIGPWLKAT